MEIVSLPISLSTLDHELRIPLTRILGWVNFLKKEPLTSIQQQYTDGILESSNQLLELAEVLSDAKELKELTDIALQQQSPSTQSEETPYVLLVEDDPCVQLIHKSILSDLGFQVDTASTAQEALALLDKKYDTVLMDIGLPDMTGIEASIEIRRRESVNKHTRIVALTAYTQEKIHAECRTAGIDQVATKPITADKLNKLIRNI